MAVTEYLGDTGNLEFELRSVNQKILTLRRTAREGRLTDTDTDPDPYPYPWNSKGGPKGPTFVSTDTDTDPGSVSVSVIF